MPENVLPQSPPPPPPPIQKKHRVSWVAVLLVIILVLVLIGLGERFMFDLNRWFNPACSQFCDYSYRTTSLVQSSTTYDRESYELYRLLIHTAFVIPVLLGAFLLYFVQHFKKSWSPKRLVLWPYLIFSLWMTLHLVFETFYFLIKQYKTLGIYIVLVLLVGLLTWLALFIQKKYHEKHEQKTPMQQ
ncbi:MAG: hypothetical protein WC505_05235 [Patescibacteria group bacterium]